MTVSKTSAIDLIIPARNEQATIAQLLKSLPESSFRHIILVDNGSTDQTARIAAEQGARVVTEPRPGYGNACLAGVRAIALDESPPPRAVAFLDADLADDPQQLPGLIAPILADQADLVIGCRSILAQRGALHPHQRLGNALACSLIRLTTGVAYRDLGPMRVIRWRSLRRLRMRDRTWGWTVEMQFKAARLGMRIRQIDVPYRRRQGGVSKISGNLITSLRAGVRIIVTIGLLWLTIPQRRPRDVGSVDVR